MGTVATSTPARVVPCVGCGGLVPDVAGPTHPYLQASAGCWQLYGEVSARQHAESGSEPGQASVHWHHVDAYAVQHPGGSEHDRRQRQSVAVHLVSLCLLREFGQPPQHASAHRGRTSQLVLPRLALADWPYLAPPADLGAVTTADLHAARTPCEQVAPGQQWMESAWSAWRAHHDTVHAWAAIAHGCRT